MTHLVEYNDLTERGKQIQDVLQEVYGTNHRGEVSVFAFELNCAIAVKLDGLLDGQSRYPRTRRGMQNLIWMHYPGGDTASAATNQILERLGVDLD